MISDALLDVVFEPLAWFIGLLPEHTIDLTGIAEGASYLGYVGEFADVSALAATAGIIAAAEAASFVYKGILFIWRLTPLSG